MALPLLAADAIVVLAPVRLPIVDSALGVDGVPCPADDEQVTTVPGVVGSLASGTGASVVSGMPDCVSAENGLGPLRGEDVIAPGVVGNPIAVVPIVETCATQGPLRVSRAAATRP